MPILAGFVQCMLLASSPCKEPRAEDTDICDIRDGEPLYSVICSGKMYVRSVPYELVGTG